MRDDLTLLVDKEMEAINLCALHCEIRNLEYLLRSLALQAYLCGSLHKCNNILKKYGPAKFHGDRVTVQFKKDQQTEATVQNVKVASFSGMKDSLMLADSPVNW